MGGAYGVKKKKKEGTSGENNTQNVWRWVLSYFKGQKGKPPALSEMFMLGNKRKNCLER